MASDKQSAPTITQTDRQLLAEELKYNGLHAKAADTLTGTLGVVLQSALRAIARAREAGSMPGVVTDEMVEKAAAAYYEPGSSFMMSLRRALEAALAAARRPTDPDPAGVERAMDEFFPGGWRERLHANEVWAYMNRAIRAYLTPDPIPSPRSVRDALLATGVFPEIPPAAADRADRDASVGATTREPPDVAAGGRGVEGEITTRALEYLAERSKREQGVRSGHVYDKATPANEFRLDIGVPPPDPVSDQITALADALCEFVQYLIVAGPVRDKFVAAIKRAKGQG